MVTAKFMNSDKWMSKSQIIVTSRYLKSGSKKAESKRKNYTKYIATREGAEVRSQDKNNSAATSTEKQKQLLKELINEFPESKKYLEYEDFTSNPTMENASELISAIIERNADVIGNRQNFVGYMAMRPGAEKRGQHGLFNGSDEPIVLNQVTEEVAHHPGNVWSHVVSLRREDAVRLGYDNSERWRELVMRHISDIANAQKIPLCNMKWYAAFHDTTHHSHIHLIVYSTNPKQGYLTKDGIKWSDSYKEAHKLILNRDPKNDDYKKAEKLLLSESNNVLVLFELGKLHSTEKMGVKDDEKSLEFYEKALQGFIQIESKAKKIKPYLQYQIGMMYFKGLGTIVDNQKAVEYFEKSADKNMWASYQLGRLYFFGTDGLERNKEKAMKFLNLSAEQGNEYAQNILDNQEKFENEMLANTVFSLFVNLSRCIEDDYYNKFQSGRKMIDSKLRRMIQEKNQALGIKQEHGQTQEY